MTTLTIPKKLAGEEELVVIPRKDYEEFLALKKIVRFVKPTKTELRVIARGRKEIREGKYTSWHELKKELANTNQ